jgi:phosphatidate cytidylyltransferase
MHRKRIITAFILLPFFYFYIMYLPPEYFLLLLVVLASLAQTEFYTMFGLHRLLKYAGIAGGSVMLVVYFLRPGAVAGVILLIVLFISAMRLFIKRDPRSALVDVSAAMLGILYVPGLLAFQLSLRKAGPGWIILLYASVYAADSAAYYIGKGLGRRKLYKEMSPNKTVAGAVGSIFGGMAGAVFVKAVIFTRVSLSHALLAGAVVGVATIVGDLVESMFKRDAGVKDSSHLLPGHGGVLDKIDGVTFAGPVFYWLCNGLGMIR